MQNDVNVVHFKALGESSSRLPAVLLPVRDRAAQRLNASLQQLFDNADDALFEMADRAGSNQEQSLYFEAMRDLRLRRKSIERSFLQQYFERFAALNNLVSGKPEVRLDSVSYEDLSLVQNDALEESVAVDTMVAKALSNNAMAISHLTIRFNTQLSSKLDDGTHPLGPRRLCEAFVEACRDLDTDIKVKLIIYKLFERFVLNGLGQLYAESNRQLVEAGVLPQLKAIPQQVPGRSAKGYSGRTPAHVNSEDDGQELFGTLQSLLAQLRVPASAPVAGASSGSGESLAAGADQAITSYDLMRLLSHLQQQIPSQSLDGYDLRAQLDTALGRISERSGRKRVVGQVDEDVINLVGMLFEFILDDLTLPDSLKALIARLQIPMLKVAVLDKTFFSRGSHPARRLLNEIAAASLGWGEQSDLQRDGLYQKIEQIVQRLLTDFVDDPEIFAELLADFMAYVSDEQRRSELLEQRTRDAEEGRARAEIARLQVEHVLSLRLQEHPLPAAVQRVLREAWSQVLLLTCLKQGYESSEWRAALQTMDDLIWSIQPHHDVASRQRLLEMVPGLLKALREGLASAAFDPFSTSEFFTELESLHVQTFQQARAEVVEGTSVAAPGMPSASVVVDAPFELPTAAERIAGLTDESLDWVDSLSVGAWLEIQDEDQKLRCKLAAVIRPMGRLVFVNRTGMKVLDRTRDELALDYQEGRVRLLDDALLFDRAMTSVIGNLRGQSS
ncbi:DUF1631 domain-containing protein [Pseudomonas sp. EpS/L25]|uniref:DUF1631 domain-containing protein n=1 Tax=Pseudomonas sp. EpS/L25 TaxID=1749078 RepID=UPI00074347B1|nr:DUF1631 domain-containing protein [Pseudomonas sp. EpS/L25]KUM41634.1 thymidine phosphorylase [Pseudomonas sp. EpS/L25]